MYKSKFSYKYIYKNTYIYIYIYIYDISVSFYDLLLYFRAFKKCQKVMSPPWALQIFYPYTTQLPACVGHDGRLGYIIAIRFELPPAT